MKDIWIRVRCWISWHAMPKSVRPLFEKAIGEFADELLKELTERMKEELEELERANQAEGEGKGDVLQHVREGEKDGERDICDPEKNPLCGTICFCMTEKEKRRAAGMKGESDG